MTKQVVDGIPERPDAEMLAGYQMLSYQTAVAEVDT